MQENEIVFYLSALGLELVELGIPEDDPVELVVVGGVFMLTQVHNRSATDDVDVMVINPDEVTDYERYTIFKNAVRFVAHDNQIHPAWLSDTISDFLRTIGQPSQVTLWRQFEALRIYVPSMEYILVLKFLAGRRKDMGDIQVLTQRLKINSRRKAQKLIDKYVSRETQDSHNVQQLFDILF